MGTIGATQSRKVRRVTFQEALITARESEATPTFDPESKNLFFEYDEEDGSHHTVWFLDAVTAYNQMRAASGYKPAGYAIWRLGSEDPSIWSILRTSQNTGPDALRKIEYGYLVDFEGNGELLEVMSRPQSGQRNIDIDPATGFIKSEQNNVDRHRLMWSQRTGDRPGLIALTFDDGPDPRLDTSHSRHSQTRECAGNLLHNRQKRTGVSGTLASNS